MNIYNYSRTTGEYMYESTADESPLEPDVYLIPSFATTQEPPKTDINQVAVFNSTQSEWDIKPDFRGKVFYDSSNSYAPTTIDSIGSVPSNLISQIPDSFILQTTKANRINTNNLNTYSRFNSGITYNNNLFDMNDTAKNNILLILQLSDPTVNTPYRDFNSEVVDMSYADLKLLATAIIKLTGLIYTTQKSNNDLINSAKTLDELNAIDLDYTKLN